MKILPASPLRSPSSWRCTPGLWGRPGQVHECGMQVSRLGLRDDAHDLTFCENSPLVQNFESPHLSAREVAHLAAGAVGKADTREHFTSAQAGPAPVYAVQGGMIQQVLRDREIEVEGAW